jgi:hypothetical protein
MNINAQLNNTIVLHHDKIDSEHDWCKIILNDIEILPTAMVFEVKRCGS